MEELLCVACYELRAVMNLVSSGKPNRAKEEPPRSVPADELRISTQLGLLLQGSGVHRSQRNLQRLPQTVLMVEGIGVEVW